MIGEVELQELIEFSGGNVLSVYLNADLRQEMKEKCKLLFKDKIKVLRGSLSDNKEDVRDLERGRERIERFLDMEYDWRSRGLALFWSQYPAFWRAFTFPVPMPTMVFWTGKPYIKPLTDLMDRYRGYGVVLMDRESVRLFHIQGGVIRDASEATGEEVKRHKQGGWAQARYQRWVDKHAMQNLKQAAGMTTQFCGDCERIILGGTEANLSQFREMLPKSLQDRIVGTLPFDKSTSTSEILERSLEVIEHNERKREKVLIEEMITTARKGGLGVTGLADALFRLHEGRVRMLIVEEGFRAPGYHCETCDYVSAEEMPKCLFCSSDRIRPISDAVNWAVQKALQMGAHVEAVPPNEELARVGHIGALLRY